MRLGTNKKKIFTFFKKLTVFALLFAIILLPFSSIIKIEVAQAKCISTQSGQEVPAQDGQCPDWAPGDAGEPSMGGNASECNVLGGAIGIGNCLSGIIYIFTVGLGSGIAWVGATFLNFAVHLSLQSASYALDFVATGWTTARDIANMGFIFILIYLAVTIMFQANTSGTMHTLAGVIVVALLINFSFFFTRVVIDAGNILSVQFYNAIAAKSVVVEGTNVPDITRGIMEGVDLQTALNSESFKTFANSYSNASGFIPYVISMSFIFISIGAIFFMLAATFLTAGVQFLVRIVVLWFVIIASPLALVARASGLKQLEHYYHIWQSNLIKHAFYPVAFLFIFWILTSFMGGADATQAGGYLTNLFNDLATKTGSTNFMQEMGIRIAQLCIRLGFVVAMVYLAVRAAGQFGTMGAKAAQNFGQRFSLGGLAGYTKGLSWAGRVAARPVVAPATQFVGMGAYDLNNSLKKMPGLRNITKPLRENVLQPLSKTSIVGEKSFDQLRKEAPAKALIRKATTKPEDLTDQEKKDLNHISTEVFATISPSAIQSMIKAGVLTEEGMKHVNAVKNFDDGDKHDISHAWDERQGREQIKVLQEIDDKLGGLTAKTDEGDMKVQELLKKNIVLDNKNTKILKATFQRAHDEAQATHKEAESRLQTAISQQTEARKAGNTAAERAAEKLVSEAKGQLVQAKTLERNAGEAIKKLDKAPKKEEKADAH